MIGKKEGGMVGLRYETQQIMECHERLELGFVHLTQPTWLLEATSISKKKNGLCLTVAESMPRVLREAVENLARHARRRPRARALASTTVNSSPPRRAMMSPGRRQDLSARPRPWQRVADVMPEGVVDDLEAIEVKKHDRHQAVDTLGVDQRLLQAFEQQHAVGQLGEGVVKREVAQAFLGVPCARSRPRQSRAGGAPPPPPPPQAVFQSR